MTAKTTSKLSIAIPTCNRATFIEHFLILHRPLLEKHGINILISDNASTDNTQEVVKNFKKTYSNLEYRQNEENLGADRNIELALKMSTTEYTWLLGDTYCFDEKLLNYILSAIESGFDHILLNVGNEVKKNKKPNIHRQEQITRRPILANHVP
ncbi:glycosyltransferase family 2 protein [Pseudomonas piscis]|uniref:glycosyltransferase family 2 protein n=1 Tax=Pseudomonas piscis TaxID=2614538 RepID=UPI001F20C60C|nr:glycosyltransferase family 2 protein [Pseudomonas piscis]